jgi:hypothetical protein
MEASEPDQGPARLESDPPHSEEPAPVVGGSPETLDAKLDAVESQPARRTGGFAQVAGAVGLVALLLAAGAGGWFYGHYGDSAGAPGDARLDAIMQRLDRIAGEIESQAGRLQATESAIDRVAAAVSNVESTAEAARRAAETGAGDQRPAQLQATINDLAERVAESSDDAQVAELAQRIGSIEQALSGLRTDVVSEVQKADSASAIGNAYSALADRIAQGAPYAAELDRLAALVPNAPGLDVLRQHALSGVATLPALDERLAQLAKQRQDVPQPVSAESAQEGLWSAMRERLEGFVKVRKLDEANWQPVMSQASQALKNGNLASAIAMIEEAPERPPSELQQWLAEAKARREVEEARDRLSASVLRQLAGQG